MEVVNRILEDWRSLRPDGMVASSERLADVLDCAHGHVRKSALRGVISSQDAYILVHAWGGAPPIERIVVRAGDGCIHFLRFWRGMHELWRRLRGDAQDEPIADEIAAFRDTVLRNLDSSAGFMTRSQLRERVAAAKDMSEDQVAWIPLEESLATAGAASREAPRLRPWHGAAAALADPARVRGLVTSGVGALVIAAGSSGLRHRRWGDGARDGNGTGGGGGGGVTATPSSAAEEREDSVGAETTPEAKEAEWGQALLGLEEISTLLFAWIQELVEDYCHGARSARIRAVCDVAGCTLREACTHLGSQGWDVEFALLSFFGQGAQASRAGAGWSTKGARLRLSEVECPICAEPYSAQLKSTATPCCFQTLCARCRARLVSRQGFECPFCRRVNDGIGADRCLGLPWAACPMRTFGTLRESIRTEAVRVFTSAARGGVEEPQPPAPAAVVDAR